MTPGADLHDHKPLIQSGDQGQSCRGVPTLLVEKFSGSDDQVTATSDGREVVLRVDGETHKLSRADAAELRDSLEEALTERTEFFRTAGEHREDGTYVVSRRGANSSGHRKVFESFEHLRRLYGRLPAEFTAEDVGRSGLTGGRRHMLVRHFAEHPAFDCELVSRQPLTVRKTEPTAEEATAETPPEEVIAPTD